MAPVRVAVEMSGYVSMTETTGKSTIRGIEGCQCKGGVDPYPDIWITNDCSIHNPLAKFIRGEPVNIVGITELLGLTDE